MNAAAATATGGQCHSNPCKDLSHSMSLPVLDSGCVGGWQVAAQAVATFVYFLLQSTLLSVVKGRANQLTLLSLTHATPSLSLLLSPSLSVSLCWQTQIQQRNIFHFSLVSFASFFYFFRFPCHLAFYFDKLPAILSPPLSIARPLPFHTCDIKLLPKNAGVHSTRSDIPLGSLIHSVIQLFITFGMHFMWVYAK